MIAKNVKYKHQIILLIIFLIIITMRTKANTPTKKTEPIFKPTKFGFKKSKRVIKYIVVHTTASVAGKDFDAKDIDQWHKASGWDGIGYNYVVKLDGTLENGRNIDLVPAHVKGYNSNSIGIVYVGGVDAQKKPLDSRTDAQKNTLLNALIELRTLYPDAIIQGHRDFPNVAKACPCFNAKTEYSNI